MWWFTAKRDTEIDFDADFRGVRVENEYCVKVPGPDGQNLVSSVLRLAECLHVESM